MKDFKINNICQQTSTEIPPSEHTVICKADSGATRNYFTENESYVLNDQQVIENGPKVGLPNGATLVSYLRGNIPFNKILTSEAMQAHVFKGLTNSSLISIGQLCDDGCVAVFDKKMLHVFKKGDVVLTGTRNSYDGLWDITITKNTGRSEIPPTTTEYKKPTANVIIRADQTKTNLAEYLHKCAFSPTLSTLTKAISRGDLLTWPGVENLNFRKLIKNTLPTAKGHLDQERRNLQSTKVSLSNDEIEDLDFNPTDGVGVKTYTAKNRSIIKRFRASFLILILNISKLRQTY